MVRRKCSALDWARQFERDDRLRRIPYKRPGPKPGTARGPRKAPANGKPAAFYVPINIDLGEYPADLRWYIAYFLNLIHWRWICKWKWLSTKERSERFVRLKARYVTRIIPPKAWAKVKRLLLDAKVVECDGIANAGRKCLRYRLRDNYSATHRIVCTDNSINRRIWRLMVKDEMTRQPVHRWLRQNLDRLEIDVGKAVAIIAKLKPKKRKRKVPSSTAEYRHVLTEQCQLIDNKDHRLTCDKYGRVHTLLTSLKKELRSCLRVTVDGKQQPLVEIDLSNSQPLIAGIVALRYYRCSNMSRCRLANIKFTAANPYLATSKSLAKATPTKIRQGRKEGDGTTWPITGNYHSLNDCTLKDLRFPSPVTIPVDLREYIRSCEEGRLYETLTLPGENVKRNKRRVLVAFYKANRMGRWPNVMSLRIKKLYPSIAAMLKAMKRKEHARAAHIMQNYEATIFVSIICNRIRIERPDVPAGVHDPRRTFDDPGARQIRQESDRRRISENRCHAQTERGAIRSVCLRPIIKKCCFICSMRDRRCIGSWPPATTGRRSWRSRRNFASSVKVSRSSPVANTALGRSIERQIDRSAERVCKLQLASENRRLYMSRWELLLGVALSLVFRLPTCAGAGETQEGKKNDDPIRIVILTGLQHPAHDWRATTKELREILGLNPRMQITEFHNPEFLATKELTQHDAILVNYMNHERPSPSDAAKAGLLRFVEGGKGFVAIHYTNGAFLDWPDFRKLVRRVWVQKVSGHDPYGRFLVEISPSDHPITKGLKDFETTDELYFKQQGDLPITSLAVARSRVTGQKEPMAFVSKQGKGRVFQTVLGHDAAALRNPGAAELLRRGCAWAAGKLD